MTRLPTALLGGDAGGQHPRRFSEHSVKKSFLRATNSRAMKRYLG